MRSAAAHYETLLGPVYSWMLGDIDAALAQSAAELDELQLPSRGGVALDLGAGFGLHAIPLGRRGFGVTAIDSCAVLLDELRARGAALPIRSIQADLLEFGAFITEPPAVILCMGDTLTHLQTLSAVESLLAAVAHALAPAGVFATTFRDYATRTLEGDRRFILVRADERRILTCFLEYGEHVVTVYDLLNQCENGRWRQAVSSYPKLRLAPEWVASKLIENGLTVRRDTSPNGMVRIVGRKGVG
jgi:SAM-dependent methyltransferase